MKRNILVSIIIPTKNEEKNIKRLLTSLNLIQDDKRWEVIVVDNFSKDGTKEIAHNWGAKVFEKGPERSAQRNFGANKAKGRVLVFLDADMEVISSYFFSEFHNLKYENYSYTIPEISVPSTLWDKWRAYYRSFIAFDLSVEAPRVFLKNNFLKMHGYDERLNACEDWDLRDRIVTITNIKRMQQAVYHHESITTIFKQMKKKFYYATYLPIYLSKQKNKVMSKETIYFLRPSYKKMIKTFFKHPISVMGASLLLTIEAASGFFGFLYGKYNTR